MNKLFLIPVLCLTCVACDNQRHDKNTRDVKARELADMSSDMPASSSETNSSKNYSQSKYSDSYSQPNSSYSQSKYSDYSQPKPSYPQSKYSDSSALPKSSYSESKYSDRSEPMHPYAKPSGDMRIEVSTPGTTMYDSTSTMMGSDTEMDRMIMQRIRDLLMKDEALSSKAKNIQIIVLNRNVTLRGPVATPQEKERILMKLKEIKDIKKVDNQLSSAS